MAFYRESEEGLSREYKITSILDSYHTGKSQLDIVRTENFGDALFLDNELQLTTKDEYIYHESLVHPVMSLSETNKKVCILGGGDGCAAREVLKWGNIEHIDIIDWDREMIHLFTHRYSSWNKMSLQSPKVRIYCEDIVSYTPEKKYDVVIVDLLDPNCNDKYSSILWPYVISKVSGLIEHNGSIVINAGGITPWNTQHVEWIAMMLSSQFCDNTTYTIQVYKTFVPSFQTEWCFFLISPLVYSVNTSLFENCTALKYFDRNAWFAATAWTKDYEIGLPTERIKLSEYSPYL
jgi:spermidine synthase